MKAAVIRGAGQLEGDPASLAVEDFWTLEPSQEAIESLGR